MAKVTCRYDIDIDITTGWPRWEEEYAAGIANFALTAQAKNDGELVGETIRFPVADGHAVYGILSENPLHLCHINEGDGYQIPDAHARGLNLTDVREMVRAEKAINKLFAEK